MATIRPLLIATSALYVSLAVAIVPWRMTVSKAATIGATLRKESRGGHTRSDFPNADPEYGKINFAQSTSNGQWDGEINVVESPIWQKKREEGTLQRPSILELFHPEFRKTALLSCFMMACAYAASFGMLQHFARIIPGAPEVKILAHADQQKIVSALQGVQERLGPLPEPSTALVLVLGLLGVLAAVWARFSVLRCSRI